MELKTFTALGTNRELLAGASITAKVHGSSTAKPMYIDAGGTTPFSPAITDATGMATFACADGLVDVTFTMPDGRVRTLTVSFSDASTLAGSLAASSGASMIGYAVSYVGYAVRTLLAKLRDTDFVTDFAGVDPTGATSSSTGLAAALAAGVPLYWPKGTYTLSTDLVIPDGANIKFGGRKFVNINKAVSGSVSSMLRTAPATLDGSGNIVQNRNIKLSGGATINVDNTVDHGFTLEGCTGCVIEDFYIPGAANVSNFRISSTLLSSSPLKSGLCNRNTIRNIYILNPKVGFLQRPAAGDTTVSIGNENIYDQTIVEGHTDTAYRNESGEAVVCSYTRAFTPHVGTIMYYVNDAACRFDHPKLDSSAYPTVSGSPNIYGYVQGQWAASDPAWAASTSFAAGSYCTSGGYRFYTAAGGTSGSNAPGLAANVFAAAVSDGGITDWVQTLPSASLYNIGIYFDTNATSGYVCGLEGLGCYQMITGANDTVMKSITVVGRNGQNTIPNLTVRTQLTLGNGNNQNHTLTTGSTSLTENIDANAYNTSGTLVRKTSFQGNEAARVFMTAGGASTTAGYAIGKTSASASTQGAAITGAGLVQGINNGAVPMVLGRLDSASGSYTIANFQVNVSGTQTTVGSISSSNSSSTTTYGTTSDPRAKEFSGPADLSVCRERVNLVKLYNGRMKGTTLDRVLFRSDEIEVNFPYATAGSATAEEPDTYDVWDADSQTLLHVQLTNEDGSPKMRPVYQQVDYSLFMPEVIGNLQAVNADQVATDARIAALEARLTAMGG